MALFITALCSILPAITAFSQRPAKPIERPFRKIREDFFLALSFRNLELNSHCGIGLIRSPIRVCMRQHSVSSEERHHLRPLPLAPFRSALRLELSISRDGMAASLRMRRLATIKTLTGFDLTFQPSLDRVRIFMLAQLGFVGRHEVIHFLGPPGTGKSHRESRSASKLSKPARASTSAGPVS